LVLCHLRCEHIDVLHRYLVAVFLAKLFSELLGLLFQRRRWRTFFPAR
jgi:hypothetical protein